MPPLRRRFQPLATLRQHYFSSIIIFLLRLFSASDFSSPFRQITPFRFAFDAVFRHAAAALIFARRCAFAAAAG